MVLSEFDRLRIEEVHRIITLPDPPEWDGTVTRRINDLSDDTLIGAIEKGKLLDFGLRNKQFQLTQESLNAAGIRLPLRAAKVSGAAKNITNIGGFSRYR
jgi:hypothetical protein